MNDVLIHKINQYIKIKDLDKRSSIADQRSVKWVLERNDCITGSIVAQAIGIMGESAQKGILLEKSSMGQYKTFFGNHSTHFGNMMEPVSNMIYCLIYGTNINMFNQIKHQNIDFLAASTDGVTDELVNIEIKSLYSREIRENYVKKEYYHQMQLQMECLGLELTHFIEVKYDIHSHTTNTTNTNSIRGIIIECWQCQKNSLEYFYSDITVSNTNLQSWYDYTIQFINSRDDLIYIRDINWSLNTFYVQEVPRDHNWLTEYLPKLRAFWDRVLYYRQHPAELEVLMNKKKKKKKPKNPANDLTNCLLLD